MPILAGKVIKVQKKGEIEQRWKRAWHTNMRRSQKMMDVIMI